MDGDITRYAYDAAGRRIETSLSSLITSYSYDSVGNLLEQVTSGASEIAFSYSYNKNGYITGEARTEGGETTTNDYTYVTGREGEVWVQNGVRFDGMRDGVLLEAKDHYSQFIDVNTGEFYDWFGGQSSLLDEASRQIAVSEGALIEWHFSEERTLHAFEQLFSSQNIEGISLVFDPIK